VCGWDWLTVKAQAKHGTGVQAELAAARKEFEEQRLSLAAASARAEQLAAEVSVHACIERVCARARM
jgi:hypothetical protein